MLRILANKQRRLEQLITYSWTPGFDYEEARKQKQNIGTYITISRYTGEFPEA